MMGVKLVIANSVLCVTLVLLAYSPPVVIGFRICQSTVFFNQKSTLCNEDSYCCGPDLSDCCTQSGPGPSGMMNDQVSEVVAAFIVLMAFTCCCVCCYRCCCRRTTSRGFVYSAPGTTTAVSVTLPPQQSQHVPYPTVVPYPQQTPYPPQYNPPTNPYYGIPPPTYGIAVSSENQHASYPSAPYIQS